MDVVEALGQVPQDELRVRAFGEDVQEVRGCDEVKPGKRDSFRLQVILQRLLAHLQKPEHAFEVLEPFVDVARLHDVGDVRCVAHHVRKLRVDAVEPLGVVGELHPYILRADEHALEHAPLLGDVGPHRQDTVHGSELLLPVIDDLLELSALDVLVGSEVL